MLYLVSIAVLIASGLILYALDSVRKSRVESTVVDQNGCKPLKCLPNKTYPPFGLDKLGKVIEAEKAKAYPLLMLGDHEKYGDTYAQWGGPVYTVITCNPDNIREILMKQFENFEVGSGRHGCLMPLLGDGIFTQDGLKWKHSRKLLAPMIQRPTLPDRELELVERHFQNLISKIERTSTPIDQDRGSYINLKDLLFDLSLDLTTEYLLGDPAQWAAQTGTGPQTSAWGDSFATEFNAAFQWIARRERLKGFYWMIDGLQFRRACGAAKNKVDDVIRSSRRALQDQHTSAKSYIALEPLLRQSVEVGEIRDQFMNLLLAGRDTSGSLLCWIIYALTREPDLMRKIRKEMAEIYDDGDVRRQPGKKDLERMQVLDCFITETLRVFPPVPLNCRFSMQATTLPRGGGKDGQSPILIPKGTLIAFSTFATHHSKNLYGEDASKFRITRWQDDDVKQRTVDWSYHPFIGGRRECLGKRFAIAQAKYLTCRLLQYFAHIEPSDDKGNTVTPRPEGEWVKDVKYYVGLTMSPDDGVWVCLGSDR